MNAKNVAYCWQGRSQDLGMAGGGADGDEAIKYFVPHIILPNNSIFKCD